MVADDVVQQVCLACLMKSYKDVGKLDQYLMNTVYFNNPHKITSLKHYFDFKSYSISDNFLVQDEITKRKFIKNLYYYTYDKMIKKIAKIDFVSEQIAEQVQKILCEFKIDSTVYKFRLSIDYENKKALSKIGTGL